jgi:hypothetical protein
VVSLRYSDPFGKKCEQKYELTYEFPLHEQFFSEESLKEALEAFAFTSEMKNILREAGNIKSIS